MISSPPPSSAGVTGTEALVVARRIVDRHIPQLAFGGLSIDSAGFVQITVMGTETLIKARVALKLEEQGAMTNRWAGVVDDVHVALVLRIPCGVFPPRRTPEAA